MIADLRPLNDSPPTGSGRQLRAFMCVRNEADRLPHILSHYRRAGVDWFFVIDNRSRDGTLDFLRKQPDCTVYDAAGSYGASQFGMNWINALLEEHGIGHWRLFVDADEILVYPHCEDVKLPKLCDFLQSRGYEGMYAFMLDMYSPGPIADAVYQTGQDFLDVCPLFDSDYVFRKRLHLPGQRPAFPGFEVVGGPRLRKLYPEFRGRSALGYAVPRAVTKLRNSSVGRRLRLHRWVREASSPPLLSKLPLSFGAPGRIYMISHRTVPLRLAPMTGVLLHFKFFADFHQRVTAALTEGQHFDGGSEYARYATALQSEPAFGFAHSGSVRYAGSGDLTERGLMRSDRDYEAFWSRSIVQSATRVATSADIDPVIAA